MDYSGYVGPVRPPASEAGPSSQRSAPYPQPKLKADKLQRTKLACAGCHRAKQRCEGLEDWPCHRCKTMKIDCIFPSYPSNASDKSASSPKPRMKPGPKPKPKVDRTASPAPPPPPAELASASPVATAATPDVAEQLRLMTARLTSLEATLARAQVSIAPVPGPTLPGSSSFSHPTPASSDSPLTNGPHHLHHHNYRSAVDTSNPVEAAGEAMAVEGLVDLGGPGMLWRADVLSRNLMSLAEVEAEFALFFTHISPWAAYLSDTLDRNPLEVRTRSPLLFTAILLTAVYYRPTTQANLELYKAISSIFDSLIAPMILCPQPDQLSSDFIRAIDLVRIYKPVAYAALQARGVTDIASIQHASKLNVRSSWMLRGLVARLSAYIGLPQITSVFAQAFAEQNTRPIPDEIVNEQRLYFGAIFHEAHGALQSGKPSNFLKDEALKTTRLFAALKRQPSDTRLAASVELAATAANLLATKQEYDRVNPADLARFDAEMAAWHEYWAPLVSRHDEDPLASTTLFPYAAFISTIVHGFTFSRWKAERKLAGAGQGDLAEWSQDDYDSTLKAVNAAQGILLAVTVEGKRVTSNGIHTSWDNVGDRLTLDPEAVERLRWAPDSITCVVFSYPLLFLGRLANEGLLQFDLTLHPPTHKPTSLGPNPSDAAPSLGDKLCRLFTLSAELLQAIAPHAEHPATRQAQFLLQIRDAGLSGRRGAGYSRPGSPLQNYNPLPPAVARSNSQQQIEGTVAPPSAGLYSFPPSFGPTPIGSPKVSGMTNTNGDAAQEQDQFASLLSDMFQTGQPYLGMDFNFAGAGQAAMGPQPGAVDWNGLGFGDY